jgi:CheY-like chemotaxis protein
MTRNKRVPGRSASAANQIHIPMKKKLTCIMLVDDDANDNFYHEREIRKAGAGIRVIAKMSGVEALEYLVSGQETPGLIFLDINMPVMDGWEFLSEVSRLDSELTGGIMVMMLTSSRNPLDELRAKAWGFVSGFLNKPLTREILDDIIDKYFEG